MPYPGAEGFDPWPFRHRNQPETLCPASARISSISVVVPVVNVVEVVTVVLGLVVVPIILIILLATPGLLFNVIVEV